MKEKEFISIAELAKIMGLSRIAVYKQVKQGKIKAIRVGRSFAIPQDYVRENTVAVSGRPLGDAAKNKIDKAVEKTVQEYGEVLKLLGQA